MADTSYAHMFKIILLGNSGVGKSQILQRFTKGKFNEAYTTTVGAEFATKELILKNNVKVRVQIWDTAGQEKFQTITRAFYRGSVGALLVYDITDKSSFESCQKWLDEIKKNTSENQLAILLVGNKKDLVENQQVQTQVALDFAQKNSLALYSSSAKSGENVDVIFQYLVEEIYSQIEKNQQSGTNSLQETKKESPQVNNEKKQEQFEDPPMRQQMKSQENKGSTLQHPNVTKKNKKNGKTCC